MIWILPLAKDEAENERRKDDYAAMIDRLPYSTLERLLKPCLAGLPASDIAKQLQPINDLRGHIAHRGLKSADYRGRNPFTDHDCLAQVFFDCWAVGKQLDEFLEHMVLDPQYRARVNARHCDACTHEQCDGCKQSDVELSSETVKNASETGRFFMLRLCKACLAFANAGTLEFEAKPGWPPSARKTV